MNPSGNFVAIISLIATASASIYASNQQSRTNELQQENIVKIEQLRHENNLKIQQIKSQSKIDLIELEKKLKRRESHCEKIEYAIKDLTKIEFETKNDNIGLKKRKSSSRGYIHLLSEDLRSTLISEVNDGKDFLPSMRASLAINYQNCIFIE